MVFIEATMRKVVNGVSLFLSLVLSKVLNWVVYKPLICDIIDGQSMVKGLTMMKNTVRHRRRNVYDALTTEVRARFNAA